MLAARSASLLEVVEVKDEVHGKDEIIFTVYRLPSGTYSYSVQCRLGHFVRSIFPQSVECLYESPTAAHRAAVAIMRAWTRENRSARMRLRQFALLAVGQREFDF